MGVLWLALVNLCIAFAGGQDFPRGPNLQLTPGSLCQHPDRYRYPEKIPYCERNVSPGTKDDVIRHYDRELGYHVQQMPRREFKIDHYIPLCMGGSNEPNNLWPQHETVYTVTDPMEALACEKMALGRLRQARAIELIKAGKADLSKVAAILQQIESL